jgi:hypothetical protein
MARYRNPANGYSESVTLLSMLGAFLLGPIWYALQGLWAHALIQLLAIILFSGFFLFWPLIVVVWLLYALAAPWLLSRAFLRRGWQRV